MRDEKVSIWIETYVDVLWDNRHRPMGVMEIWHACRGYMPYHWLKRALKEWAQDAPDSIAMTSKGNKRFFQLVTDSESQYGIPAHPAKQPAT